MTLLAETKGLPGDLFPSALPLPSGPGTMPALTGEVTFLWLKRKAGQITTPVAVRAFGEMRVA